jgi:hypothetical protein
MLSLGRRDCLSLSLRGGKLASQYKDKLKIQLHDKALTVFIKEKKSWTQQTFDTVNWNACGTAFKRLSKNRQINVSKSCFNYWHTGAIHTTFYQEERPCCFCNNKKEAWKHILTCGSLDANLNRAASWAKLNKLMEVWHLPNDFWTAVEKGVGHTIPPTAKERRTTSHFPLRYQRIMGACNFGKRPNNNPR